MIVVSDDSPDENVRSQNRAISQQYENVQYLVGPRNGVCANRNQALSACLKTQTDYISFVDDDICVHPNFIESALIEYEKMSESVRCQTILTGISRTHDGDELLPGRLTFRGYFIPSISPETVVIHAAVFPREFLDQEQWDENIFFGYEDAELCLRAIKQGYKIVSVPNLQVKNICFLEGTLNTEKPDGLTDYEIYIEAARLYVGVKRYKNVFPNSLKLISFIVVYFSHMLFYLVRRHSLNKMWEIVKRSHVNRLWDYSSLSHDS